MEVNAQSQSICIWGRLGVNTVVNGLYAVSGQYYEKSVNGPWIGCIEQGIYYLYYQSNEWRVGQTLGGNDHFAYCTATSPTSVSCTGNWSIYESSTWVEDPNVYTTNGQCPEWNCNGIAVLGSRSSLCNGNFDTVEGTQNAYQKQGAIYWIYFHPTKYFWVCSHELEPNQCSIKYEETSSVGWEDFEPSDPIRDKGDVGNIDCLPFPTKSPTAQPTPEPTKSPTPSPVNHCL